MQAISSRDTGPELKVRRLVHGMGYRYRLHHAHLPGKPDLAFPARRAVIFVHGCFWHNHDCPRGATKPRTNAAFWQKKLAGNAARDQRVQAELTAAGWRVMIIWGCEIGDPDALGLRIRSFLDTVQRPGRRVT